MCLRIDPKLTKTKVFGKNRRRIVCWKVVFDKTRAAPFYCGPDYLPNTTCVSDREDKQLNHDEEIFVNHGIHVFLHKHQALHFCKIGQTVIKVICHRDDFVAAGVWDVNSYYQQAVFMKVFVPLDCDDLDPKEIALSCV